MPLTAIEIEGFGPYTQRQRIPIRPLTLLFGPNSTGKTSLFRAIHHAQHCLLKAEVPQRESSLCKGFDLLEPIDRYSRDRDISKGHSIKFVLDEVPLIDDESRPVPSILKSPINTNFKNAYVEVKTARYLDMPLEDHDRITLEIGIDGVPILESNEERFRCETQYFLNLCHPIFSFDTNTFANSDSIASKLWKSARRSSHAFGWVDSLAPAFRTSVQECYLQSDTISLDYMTSKPSRFTSYRDGGNCIDSKPINSWIENSANDIRFIGEIKVYDTLKDEDFCRYYPQLQGLKFILQKPVEDSSKIRLVGAIAEDQLDIDSLLLSAEEKSRLKGSFEDDFIHPEQFHKKRESRIYQSSSPEFFTRFCFARTSFRNKDSLNGRAYWDERDITSIISWYDSITPRVGENRLGLGTSLVSDLYHMLGLTENSQDLRDVGNVIQECIKGIFQAVKKQCQELIHVGPLRETQISNKLLDEFDWYKGEAAWLPASKREDELLPEMNSIFRDIDIRYELQIHRHRDSELFAEWLRNGADISNRARFFSEDQKTKYETVIEAIESGLTNKFAQLITIWTELEVFNRSDDTDTTIPPSFDLSPLDRYRFLPLNINANTAIHSTVKHYTASQLGEGIRQIFPIIRASVYAADDYVGHLVLIQQPELHLHPRMQLGLADVLIKHRNCSIIETHSEHIILRVLKRIHETSQGHHADTPLAINPDDVSVVYLQPPAIQEAPTGSEDPPGVRALRLRISEDGDFIDPWPQGFFEERLEDLFSDEGL